MRSAQAWSSSWAACSPGSAAVQSRNSPTISATASASPIPGAMPDAANASSVRRTPYSVTAANSSALSRNV